MFAASCKPDPESYVKLSATSLLQGDETFKRQLAAADASRLHTVVVNKLGVPARMELDFGDHMYGLHKHDEDGGCTCQ